MGSDIHIFVEYKNTDIDWWQTIIDDARGPRCYDLFARLADNRNYDGVKTVPLIGLPEDHNFGFCIITEPSELHHWNTITLKDWKEHTKDHGPIYGAITVCAEYLAKADYQVRIIVGFDS